MLNARTLAGIIASVAIWSAPPGGSARAQDAPDGADALVITTRFFGGARYSYEGSEPRSVFGWGLTFRDDFEETMTRHPQALEVAKGAYPWNALAFLGGVGTVTVTGKLLIDTIRDARTLEQGQFPDESFPTSDVVLLLASGAAMLVGNAAAGDRFSEGVELFNRLEAERTKRSRTFPSPGAVHAALQPLIELGGPGTAHASALPAAGVVLALSF